MLKKIIIFFLFATFLMFHVSAVKAADYRADYLVQYFLSEENNSLNTNVQFTIKITNSKTDVYVNKYSISFPKSFLIKDLKASDDSQQITPQTTVDDAKTKIDLEFSHPNTGRDSVNTFNLQFTQQNLFQVNGNVWEVILPTIENRGVGDYKVIVNLPQNTNKKISISKPKPTLITGNQIIWDNPTSRTVYAVFGDSQIYELRLTYHLNNPNLYPVLTDIALPPDTLYQKIYVISLDPKPSLTYSDNDGNYLARYYLNPKQNLPVTFTGNAQLSVKPREEVIPVMRNLSQSQQNYLLTARKYWQVSNVPLSLNTPYSIYRDVVDTLRYDYNKVVTQNKRLGAEGVLKTPNNAVCVEFSDLFIAYAREKGVYSREMEGFGFTKDPQLRPLSLVSDVLHSWPEFYDKDSGLWIQVDPTWENTSGIDYFNSFDLNHIVFAIHGEKSDYPLPAGMYKTENSRDVSVTASTEKLIEKRDITITSTKLSSKILDNKIVSSTVTITNNGNVYLWNIPFRLSSDILNFSTNQYIITVLAPYEKKGIQIRYWSKVKNKKLNGALIFTAYDKEIVSYPIIVIPYSYDLALKISSSIAVLLFLMLLAKIYRSRKQ